MKKKVKEGKYKKFISILRELTINIPFVKSLKQISGYTKFINNLVTKKRMVSHELIDNVHHYCTIAFRSLVKKKEDLGSFMIPCTIGSFNFTKALYDSGTTLT